MPPRVPSATIGSRPRPNMRNTCTLTHEKHSNLETFHVENNKFSSLLMRLGTDEKKQYWNKFNFCYTKNNFFVVLLIRNGAGHYNFFLCKFSM